MFLAEETFFINVSCSFNITFIWRVLAWNYCTCTVLLVDLDVKTNNTSVNEQSLQTQKYSARYMPELFPLATGESTAMPNAHICWIRGMLRLKCFTDIPAELIKHLFSHFKYIGLKILSALRPVLIQRTNVMQNKSVNNCHVATYNLNYTWSSCHILSHTAAYLTHTEYTT